MRLSTSCLIFSYALLLSACEANFNEHNLFKLGIDKNNIKIKFNSEQKVYLAKHRELFKVI